MRRTTICRFERAALLALVAGLLVGWAPALAAQDTTKAPRDTTAPGRDTTQAQPADTTQGAPGGPAAFGAGQLPSSHTVTQGETLWSIAQLYFNDPLLWPEIYRLNTALIDDPHWIYPGEVFSLAAGVSVAQAPAESAAVTTPQGVPGPQPTDTVHAQAVQPAPVGADTVVAVAPPPKDTAEVLDTTQAMVVEAPPPSAAPNERYQTIFDRQPTATQEVQNTLRAYVNQPYRPVRRGEFYSAGFLTERERMPYGAVIGNTAEPSIPRLTDRTSATTFDQIAIAPPRTASYHVGDSLLLLRIDRDIAGWGDVVVPVGVVRVTELQRRQVLATVVMQFARIHEGHLALPLEPFRDPGTVRPTPVQYGLEAQVVAQRDLNVLVGPQQIIFLNRGRYDGVTPGDVFQVLAPARGLPGTASEQVEVSIEIVHVRDHSSSGLILNIEHPNLKAGMPARLIRKMPS
ncbi:MAG TPA: LysM peptidoglycan-binding domain-containing protein [Gemmatimonadales bacterium]|jgi:hypothetical protein|nr:LysM peptidoglycan-binding domain-containing protein [Gemmatimonadales bacterium]